MILVFAKHTTNEKVIVDGSLQEIPGIVKQLDEKFGGNWCQVDRLKKKEIIKYSDTQKYKGFENDKDRYFDFIELDEIEVTMVLE